MYLYDCVEGKLRHATMFPLSVGNTPECSCHIDMDPLIGGVFFQRPDGIIFTAKGEYSVNGEPYNGVLVIEPGKGYLIGVARGLFWVMFSGLSMEEMSQMLSACDPNMWFYFDAVSGGWAGPLTLHAMAQQSFPDDTWVIMSGMHNSMCRFAQLRQIAARKFTSPLAPPMQPMQPMQPVMSQTVSPVMTEVATPEPVEDAFAVSEEEGEFICPTCWLRFDVGDVMSIATHPSLMGDSVMGRDYMKRFFAKRFNNRGQALDEMGVPCTEMACPHCRRKLPPHYLSTRTRVFSIIGAPSSGKSYYLASLIHEMARVMPTEFDIIWRDSDPASNSMLNDVTNRLFNSSTPEQAHLSKTDLEGALYEEFHRHGRMVKLPKPFVYNISDVHNPHNAAGLVFYDNAGEHFEPGRNSEESPGAAHVAVASGLFFLFDPITSPPFRRLISEANDPQLKQGGVQLDQQNIIMAETSTRISTILNLGIGERISSPLAVMVGKCDLWEDKLTDHQGNPVQLQPIIKGGKLVRAAVDANSKLIRAMLMKMVPSLCTTAESITDNVRYFAISPLGCSPVSFKDSVYGEEKIGPEPGKLNPRYVCDPTLWVLSCIEPSMIPSV